MIHRVGRFKTVWGISQWNPVYKAFKLGSNEIRNTKIKLFKSSPLGPNVEFWPDDFQKQISLRFHIFE